MSSKWLAVTQGSYESSHAVYVCIRSILVTNIIPPILCTALLIQTLCNIRFIAEATLHDHHLCNQLFNFYTNSVKCCVSKSRQACCVTLACFTETSLSLSAGCVWCPCRNISVKPGGWKPKKVPSRYLGQPSPFSHPHLIKHGESVWMYLCSLFSGTGLSNSRLLNRFVTINMLQQENNLQHHSREIVQPPIGRTQLIYQELNKIK